MVAILGVIKPWTCSYTVYTTFFDTPQLRDLDLLSKLAFGSKSGFKNKRGVRVSK